MNNVHLFMIIWMICCWPLLWFKLASWNFRFCVKQCTSSRLSLSYSRDSVTFRHIGQLYLLYIGFILDSTNKDVFQWSVIFNFWNLNLIWNCFLGFSRQHIYTSADAVWSCMEFWHDFSYQQSNCQQTNKIKWKTFHCVDMEFNGCKMKFHNMS